MKKLAFTLLLLTLLGVRPLFAASEGRGVGTVITVDTTADLADTNNHDNHTCSFTAGAFFFPAADGKCTLRRAVLEAGVRPDGDRPITIQFNIATSDPNYDAVLDIWEIQIDPSWVWELDRRFLSDDGGSVTIDGDTQPGGRSDGPKIMINTNSDNSALGGRSLEIRTSNNTLRNLGFHGGGQIIMYEADNLIENNWMGLSNDGSGLQLASTASSQAMRAMARGGIIMPNEDSDGNTIRGNHIIGAFERAIRVTSGGDDNIIENNLIGMDADGDVPIGSRASIDCMRDPDYAAGWWYGGRGIQVNGSNNIIRGNRLAGLHVTQTANETPPITFDIAGFGNTVEDNIVGRDLDGDDVGVCGQGALLDGNQHLVENNLFVHTRNGFDPGDDGTTLDNVIMVQDFTTGAQFPFMTVRLNLIFDGNDLTHPDYGFRHGPAVDDDLRFKQAGKVTNISGVNISGTQGDDTDTPGGTIPGDCPNCRIYLYLDDPDIRAEAFELLGTTLADSNGDWSIALGRTLQTGECIRTQSMSTADDDIPGFGANTTTRLSDEPYCAGAPTAVALSAQSTTGGMVWTALLGALLLLLTAAAVRPAVARAT